MLRNCSVGAEHCKMVREKRCDRNGVVRSDTVSRYGAVSCDSVRYMRCDGSIR